MIAVIIVCFNVCSKAFEARHDCCAPMPPRFAEFMCKGFKTVIYVDFSEKSGLNRMFVEDLISAQSFLACPVLQGKGSGFSNKIGSKCSSLGLYKLTKVDRMANGYPCIRLDGLEETNSNAKVRGIVIHPSLMVMPFEIPLFEYPRTSSSEGCFSVNYFDFKQIVKIFNERKEVYLYAYK